MSSSNDAALESVFAWFRGQSKLEERLGRVFRRAIDEVVDGRRTGRFDVEGLAKSEKTYLGTKVEIVCRAEFELAFGDKMDYLVDGHEVDAKFSVQGPLMQTIPREAMDQILLVMHASDSTGLFSVGLIRAERRLLRAGVNQDQKRGFVQGRADKEVLWLVESGTLPENQLLGLEESVRSAVLAPGLECQARVNKLFSLVQNKMVTRSTVETVAAPQSDGPKRVRDARTALGKEGIVILGYRDDHPRIARDLGLPVAKQGEWLSVRLASASGAKSRPSTVIGGVEYVVAQEGESRVVVPPVYRI